MLLLLWVFSAAKGTLHLMPPSPLSRVAKCLVRVQAKLAQRFNIIQLREASDLPAVSACACRDVHTGTWRNK